MKIGQEANPVTEFELLMCRLQHRFVRKANAGRDGTSPAPSVTKSSVRFLRSKNLLDPSLKYPYGKKCPSFQLDHFSGQDGDLTGACCLDSRNEIGFRARRFPEKCAYSTLWEKKFVC